MRVTAPELAAELKTPHAQALTPVIAYLDYGPGKEQITRGKDSVTVIGSVIRELCYTVPPGTQPRGGGTGRQHHQRSERLPKAGAKTSAAHALSNGNTRVVWVMPKKIM